MELIKLLESVSLEASDRTVALEVMANDVRVYLTSRGKRRGKHVEILNMKEAYDLAALLRIAASKTSEKPLAAASEAWESPSADDGHGGDPVPLERERRCPMLEPAFVELECSDPTASLEVMAGEDRVVLTSRGRRGGLLHVETLTKKEAYDLAALLHIATRRTSEKPLAAASAG